MTCHRPHLNALKAGGLLFVRLVFRSKHGKTKKEQRRWSIVFVPVLLHDGHVPLPLLAQLRGTAPSAGRQLGSLRPSESADESEEKNRPVEEDHTMEQGLPPKYSPGRVVFLNEQSIYEIYSFS